MALDAPLRKQERAFPGEARRRASPREARLASVHAKYSSLHGGFIGQSLQLADRNVAGCERRERHQQLRFGGAPWNHSEIRMVRAPWDWLRIAVPNGRKLGGSGRDGYSEANPMEREPCEFL